MKIKAVCINLEHCVERREYMTRVAKDVQHVMPFEFSTGIYHKNVSIDTKLVQDDITINEIKIDGAVAYYNIDVRYYKHIHIDGKPTKFLHDHKRYLMDQVEHFGREHLKKNRGIIYADNVVAIDHDDPGKKMISYDGEILFYVDTSRFRKYMTMGEIACVLSHVSVLEKLLRDDEYDYYLILEDDVKLTTDTDYSLGAIVKHIQMYKTQWDIVFLNHPLFYERERLHSISEFLNIGIFSSFTQACSYIVNKKTAQYLIDGLRGFINITMDDYLSRMQTLRMFRTKQPVFMLDENISRVSNIRDYDNENV